MAQAKGAAGSRREFLLLILAVVFLAATLGVYVYTQETARHDQEYVNLARSAQQQATDLGKLGADASRGITPDFRLLEGAQANLTDAIDFIRNGDELIDLPPAPKAVHESLDFLEESWAEMNDGVNTMLDGRSAFLTADQYVYQIDDTAIQIAEATEQLVERLVDIRAPGNVISLAAEQALLLERLRTRARRVIGAGRGADITAERLAEDTQAFASNNNQLRNSVANRDARAAELIKQSSNLFTRVNEGVAGIQGVASDIAEVQESSALLSRLGTEVLASAIDVEDSLTQLRQNRPIKPVLIYVFAGLSALSLLLFVAIFLFNVRRRQVAAETSERKQQEAILTLLDDISNLADGDLTTSVTVTEDFTGAIADSINFTIETLRTLVGTINNTARQVTDAASSTLDTATSLNQASRSQNDQIGSAAESITRMTESMQDMSREAEQLAQQAETSLQTARSGGETVRSTITGMEALREQIQDTSKRIKRLGESSQEIGNIIEFINDISEQTNTLALNASIQAAMAGESGKGFAVVADEVQRLAERASSATKQIEALVKTIQADTNEAIISMERSTANVVAGSKSAQTAGGALERIESFASELARLIQQIAGTSSEQAKVAFGLNETMTQLRTIANQTADSADLTASRTRELTTLSEQMRESVSGFRLPGDDIEDDFSDMAEFDDMDTEQAA
ncbi:type IV pili methyl-accepting chemotaxis transducer PilJ [Oceanococcus atlanticus]|uniref:Type IV pili methyl-accepting chemotaxis transducer PilJ n=1 Tax=Oceanococcus atlanticus TaxID=1317117 RepID=A0A1Y1SET2_9GAMM|nr:methyl-accepting chemotaxis protein [Oceanococcus atlanticus]ORE87507.1 type IV pili methyl-accepting chemotaxis transducer PilJ [Oceanococcus atlanticus]RZO87246.1 MAG: methyl-accepting chemotaxis protein [Oceanococcus sp.]